MYYARTWSNHMHNVFERFQHIGDAREYLKLHKGGEIFIRKRLKTPNGSSYQKVLIEKTEVDTRNAGGAEFFAEFWPGIEES